MLKVISYGQFKKLIQLVLWFQFYEASILFGGSSGGGGGGGEWFIQPFCKMAVILFEMGWTVLNVIIIRFVCVSADSAARLLAFSSGCFECEWRSGKNGCKIVSLLGAIFVFRKFPKSKFIYCLVGLPAPAFYCCSTALKCRNDKNSCSSTITTPSAKLSASVHQQRAQNFGQIKQ